MPSIACGANILLWADLSPGCEVLSRRHMSGLPLVVLRIHQRRQLDSRAAYLTLTVLINICYQRAQMCVDTASPD